MNITYNYSSWGYNDDNVRSHLWLIVMVIYHFMEDQLVGATTSMAI